MKNHSIILQLFIIIFLFTNVLTKEAEWNDTLVNPWKDIKTLQILENEDPDILNKGLDCYRHCQDQGPCEWCGKKGMCCTRYAGWKDIRNGCDGTFGG